MTGRHVSANPVVQRPVVTNNIFGRHQHVRDDIAELRSLADHRHHPHAIPHPRQVTRLAHVVEVDPRLIPDIGRSQPDLAPTVCAVQHKVHLYPDRHVPVPAPLGPFGAQRHHVHDHVVAVWRAGRGIPQRHLYPPLIEVVLVSGSSSPHHENHRVVLQVLPNARHIGEHTNPVLLKMLGRPDTRKHQQLRRYDGSCRQDHLARAHLEHLSTRLSNYPNGPSALDNDPVHPAVRPDSQVQPVPRPCQVPHRRADPNAVNIVKRQRSGTRRIRQIVVGTIGQPNCTAGCVKCNLGRHTVFAFWPNAADRPLLAVKITAKIEIVLRAPKR